MDMDTYEHNVRKPSQPKSTMDAVIGIANPGVCMLTNKRLLMIELRMNYTNTNNLHGTDFLKKMEHTRDLLGKDLEVDEVAWFVFTDEVAPRAENWLNRRNLADPHRKLSKCKICSVSQFHEYIHKPSSFWRGLIKTIKLWYKKGYTDISRTIRRFMCFSCSTGWTLSR